MYISHLQCDKKQYTIIPNECSAEECKATAHSVTECNATERIVDAKTRPYNTQRNTNPRIGRYDVVNTRNTQRDGPMD